ncbi:MAG: hypothetical protein SH819_02020 [Cytophagales bacterium]|nr:hypothetical protein [Cytophagales bacterium]
MKNLNAHVTKSLLVFVLAGVAFLPAFAQESMEKVMERRAREMHRVMGLNSPDDWKKFVVENYTKEMINKPMQRKVQSDGPDAPSSSAADKEAGNVEAKAGMFRMLHDDFGGGKINSIKVTDENLKMVINADGMVGTFALRFSREKPYLIDGLGVELGGDVNR